jgi:hypothetical protein
MPDNKKNNDWKNREVAALWSKGDYYTGRLSLSNIDLNNIGPDDTIGIVMFRNKDQNEEGSRPTFNIYKAQSPVENTASPTKQSAPSQKVSKVQKEPVKAVEQSTEEGEEGEIKLREAANAVSL